MIIGLYVAATAFGGTLWPWHPRMTDLAVYRLAGATLLHGGDIYHLPNSLPFLYPPFAALLAVPLSLLPAAVVEVGWTLAGVAALLLIMRRLGVRGWALSLLGTAVIWFVEPVNQTLAYGQVGIFLVALVIIDLIPRPEGKQGLLVGALTGLAAAIKLTPGLFFLVWSPADASEPRSGWWFRSWSSPWPPQRWSRRSRSVTGPGWLTATPDSGTASSTPPISPSSAPGCAGSGWAGSAPSAGSPSARVVALLGVVAAVVWLRRGEAALGVTLGGVATLLASPVSWSHHFVWVVPLGLLLLTSTAAATLPGDRLRFRRLGRRRTVQGAAPGRRRRTHLRLDAESPGLDHPGVRPCAADQCSDRRRDDRLAKLTRSGDVAHRPDQVIEA